MFFFFFVLMELLPTYIYIYISSSSSPAESMEFSNSLSLTIRPYRPSLLENPLDYIHCPYRGLCYSTKASSPCVGVHKRTLIMSSP